MTLDERLKRLIASVSPIDYFIEKEVQAHLDDLTKPKGSLGRLEELVKQYILITGELAPAIPKKAIFVFAGDHGVTEEGISAFPKEVTYQMVYNFLNGGAGINVLARHAGADVFVVDAGVDFDFDDVPGLLIKKVARGTANMTRGPAMTRDEAITGILNGAILAQEAIDNGYGILATGEMGIGNTTPSSAVTSVLTGKLPEDVTGRGTGIDDEALKKKIQVIKKAVELNRPNPSDAIDVLSKVGGHEISAICGLILGCAANKRPVVVDGFISTAGALIAKSICPTSREYMFASHMSVEQGHRAQIGAMGLRPILDLDLRLGEGTGAALAMTIIDASIKIYGEMATFSGARVTVGNERERNQRPLVS